MTPAKFSLGRLMATPGVLEKVGINQLAQMVKRHQLGDWGELDEEDRLVNQIALRDEGRLMSVYTSSEGVTIWVITEWDRSVTTILLPEEY